MLILRRIFCYLFGHRIVGCFGSMEICRRCLMCGIKDANFKTDL